MLIRFSFPRDRCIDFAPASFLRAPDLFIFRKKREKGVEKPFSLQNVVYSSFRRDVLGTALLAGEFYQIDSKNMIVSLTPPTLVYPSLVSSV